MRDDTVKTLDFEDARAYVGDFLYETVPSEVASLWDVDGWADDLLRFANANGVASFGDVDREVFLMQGLQHVR